MKLKHKISFALTTATILGAFSATPSNAALTSERKYSPQQIIIDTGGGGGEYSGLPGVKWWFGETANGQPFMFWSWSPTD